MFNMVFYLGGPLLISLLSTLEIFLSSPGLETNLGLRKYPGGLNERFGNVFLQARSFSSFSISSLSKFSKKKSFSSSFANSSLVCWIASSLPLLCNNLYSSSVK